MLDPIQIIFIGCLTFIGWLSNLTNQNLLAFFTVAMFGLLGGDLIDLLAGYQKPKGMFPAIKIAPLITKVKTFNLVQTP